MAEAEAAEVPPRFLEMHLLLLRLASNDGGSSLRSWKNVCLSGMMNVTTYTARQSVRGEDGEHTTPLPLQCPRYKRASVT